MFTIEYCAFRLPFENICEMQHLGKPKVLRAESFTLFAFAIFGWNFEYPYMNPRWILFMAGERRKNLKHGCNQHKRINSV